MLNFLYPKLLQIKNRITFKGEGSYTKLLLLVVFGLLFWAGIFIVFYRVLHYFQGIDVFGDFLASKLLSMVFLTFFSILIFSNVITAISTFFMSEELQLIISSPFEPSDLYFSKVIETVFNSSWMVILFSLPVFFSYGIIYDQSGYYYLALPGTILPFIFICGALGGGIALTLVMVFPARRLKDVLFILTIFFIILFYVLFRMLRPERLVDPDTFFTVIDYLSSLRAPTSPLLPSQWASDVLSSLLFQRSDSEFGFNILLLWSTALALLVLLNWFFNRVYFETWSKSQEARTLRVTRQPIFNRLFSVVLSPLPRSARAIIDKDLRSFFRDTSQWSQLFILGSIVLIYLYNISVLPMEKNPMPTVYLQNIISFLNLGLTGFVICAVAVRFAYPAVSLEGESFWIVKSSPLGLKGFLWSKFWVNFLFLVVLAEILIICSNYFLNVGGFMMLLSAVTVFFMTFGITSLSIGCGAVYPRFRVENISQIPTGFGGLVYMILSVVFIALIVIIEARPVYFVLMSKFSGIPLHGFQLIQIYAYFSLVLILNIAVFLLPMHIGLKKLSAFENI